MLNAKAWGALFIAALAAGTPAPRTELLVRAVDESGRPVRLTRADVYVDGWGGGELTALERLGSTVRIGLDRDAACAREPALCANFSAFSARILLEAEGLAPISSDLFEWMNEPGRADAAQAIAITFPGSAPLRIAPGTRRDVTLTFRTRRARTLRVVDRQGRPLPDAHVTLKNFFADTNHMGFFEGDELIEDGVTGVGGELAIPDGDIVYGVNVHKPHWEVVRPRSVSWPSQFYQRLQGDVLTVVMRAHARRPLLLRFTRDGVPAEALAVSACVVPCGGACCGVMGKTDATGALTVRDFYPEEYDRVFVPIKEDDYKSIWEIDPRKVATPTRLTVALPR